MGGVEDCRWIDMIMDEIGSALTKADESIQKSIELWTELTKDIFNDRTQELTGQPNNGISGEENSSEDKSDTKVEEKPIQHWSLCLGEVKEEPTQHWAMRAFCLGASKVRESLMQEQGDYDCDYYDDDDDEEENENTVSEFCESMLELNFGTSPATFIPPRHHHHNEEDSCSSLRLKGGYELLKDVETFSEMDEEEEDETTYDYYHNEEDTGSIFKWRGRNELFKNFETSSEEDDESWDDDDEKSVREWLRKCRIMREESNESVVCHDGEDDVLDKLQGFVDLRHEDIANDMEFGETLLPECDWVFVTRD